MLNIFSEKDKLSVKGMFVLEHSALGTKHNHYFNSLVAAEWEATTLNALTMLTLSAFDPRISRKVRNPENNSSKTKPLEALGIFLSLSHLGFKTWI